MYSIACLRCNIIMYFVIFHVVMRCCLQNNYFQNNAYYIIVCTVLFKSSKTISIYYCNLMLLYTLYYYENTIESGSSSRGVPKLVPYSDTLSRTLMYSLLLIINIDSLDNCVVLVVLVILFVSVHIILIVCKLHRHIGLSHVRILFYNVCVDLCLLAYVRICICIYVCASYMRLYFWHMRTL